MSHLKKSKAIRVSKDEQVTTYFWNALYCSQCRGKYKDRVPNPFKEGEFITLNRIQKPDKNYIILESDLQADNLYPENSIPLPYWRKALHLIKFDNSKRATELKG